MWGLTSSAIAGRGRPKDVHTQPIQSNPDCSDDDVLPCVSREEGLECPICWESFNIVENVPYVLWCGHTLCKNCVLGLKWAVVKFPSLSIQLPLFISCPWCHLLSLRLFHKGDLRFPRKNFFLLWMVESMNGDRAMSHSSLHASHQLVWPSNRCVALGASGYHCNYGRPPSMQSEHSHPSSNQASIMANYLNMERIHASLHKSLAFFANSTAKFLLVLIFLLIVLYAIPASAIVLALHILVTVLFALPSFLVLYFAYPSLDWLVREIIT